MLYCIDVNTLTGSISAKEKKICFIAYTTLPPVGPPSVMSVLSMSVQLASPIGLLCEQLPKVYVFSADKIFMALCAPFPNEISDFKILAMP